MPNSAIQLGDLREYIFSYALAECEESRVEAFFKWFTSDVLKFSRADLILNSQRFLKSSELEILHEQLSLLKQGVPIQYIFGSVPFYSCNIDVDAAVLIPRPETEELVHWICCDFEHLHNITGVDVCTGSGCIAVALAKCLKSPTITGTELSDNALNKARQNGLKNNVDVNWVKDDALQSKAELSKLDFVVSNPPYVLDSDRAFMDDNVLNFEPEMALFVPDRDPLLFYRAIAQNAISWLKPGGSLYFEIHQNQAESMIKLLSTLSFTKLEVKQDMQGNNRMIKAIKS